MKNKVCGQRVLPDRSVLIGQGKCQSWKFQMRQFSRFPHNFGVKIQTDIFSIFYPKTLRNINIPNKFLFYWAINWMDFVRWDRSRNFISARQSSSLKKYGLSSFFRTPKPCHAPVVLGTRHGTSGMEFLSGYWWPKMMPCSKDTSKCITANH